MDIILDFFDLQLEAKLFNNKIAEKFMSFLPYTISLTQWGNELYGSIGKKLGKENPVSIIQEGGLAYTERGSYFCVFFGQNPAWPVEYIGQIKSQQWKALLSHQFDKMKIYKKE